MWILVNRAFKTLLKVPEPWSFICLNHSFCFASMILYDHATVTNSVLLAILAFKYCCIIFLNAWYPCPHIISIIQRKFKISLASVKKNSYLIKMINNLDSTRICPINAIGATKVSIQTKMNCWKKTLLNWHERRAKLYYY